MELDIFLKVFFICALGAMSPGPSWILVINNSIFYGRINGLFTSIGHGLGITIYAFIANLSINLIIQINEKIFLFMKICSIIFLLYLGLKSLKGHKLKLNKKLEFKKLNAFLEGFIVAILNPKVFIWFIAIYSQFISPNNNMFFNFILIATAGLVDTIWYSILVIFITRVSVVSYLEKKSHIIQKSIGYIFIFIAILLLTTTFYHL